jgi:hypothetical protein
VDSGHRLDQPVPDEQDKLMRALLATGLLAAGCTSVSVMRAECASDSQCGAGQICFVDGCGDPGRGLFVEVSTSAGGGAQDFSVGSSLEGNQTLQLAPPAFIKGSVSQPASLGGPLVPYPAKVDLAAIGQSALIPGVARTVTASINLGMVGGTFQLPVATGVYDLSVSAQDQTVPPQVIHAIAVQPGDQPFEQIVLAAANDVDKSTVKEVTVNLVYPNTSTTSTHAFVAQAFDTVTGDPLSEPATVTAVAPADGGNGNFDLFVATGSPLASAFSIVVTPVDPTSAPTNAFVVPWNVNLIGLTLAMGDYGSLVAATGRLVDQSGLAVAQAEVFIQGKVTGGGDYRSATAITGPDGTFSVQTLASATDGSGDLTLFALPPVGTDAGATAVPVVVGPGGGAVGDVPCPSRLLLNGLLRNPDGTPAANAAVSATLITAVLGTTGLSSLPQTTTDLAGSFSMLLDPGFYRLDFVPADGKVPHGSWFWPTAYSVDAGVGGVDSPIYTLSQGRTLRGTITQQPDPSSAQRPVSGASVTFFRVSNVQGLPISFPVAQTTANTDGTFSVLLPTAPDAGI